MRRGLAAVVVLTLCGCEPGDEPVEPEPVEWQPDAGALMRYTSSWDWTGAEQATTGEWVFETDLGVRVGIDVGALSTASMMLVPCSEGLRSHATISDDSLLSGPWIDDFVADLGERDYGFATASGERYCALHWLAATNEELGASIVIHGWYELDGQPRQRFEADVSLANGGLRPLVVEDVDELARASSGATVNLRRRPARALDGVNIEALTPSELAFEFLQGLTRSSQVWIAG